MAEHFTVSDVARQINRRPRDISDLFYTRKIPDADCPIVGGRRLIPASLIPTIMAALTVRPHREALNAG